MKKLLLSLLTIGLISFIGIYFTQAFFSDKEVSTSNALTSGEINLQIDNESFYNGASSPATSWEMSDLTDQLFFNFTDLKPSDYGEDTISIHGSTNPYWLCTTPTLTKDDDSACTEPELADDPNCDTVRGDNLDGELGTSLTFVFWADDGDNVWEVGESPFKRGQAENIFDGIPWSVADSTENIFGNPDEPLSPDQTYYIGKAWCLGVLSPSLLPQGDYPDGPAGDNNTNGTPGEAADGGVNCDGSNLNNAPQTDELNLDITFQATQARNNAGFVCSGITPTPPIACNQPLDVMLVLDRSGSISSSELADLKTAANSFVTALGLSPTGVHAGEVSFATSGTLDSHLTDNAGAVQAAINSLASGGLTRLVQGVDLASGELSNLAGDPHDRPDGVSPDIMIIVTDGNPNLPSPEATARAVAATAADNARALGIEVFVVGVGGDVDSTYLSTEIADDASHYFPVANYQDLQNVLTALTLCTTPTP
ncbi:hypothetical protein A3A76_06140 [Candidatus Woesebacteria bacterium RIFCSPLOWO2_01_FULL_39_23]|uniref:VWFA domain-containing protein n=1 Tax=Candidatus Woesebacteria bacterium RIFCSPHIGHO2_01_FULL_40_22 TaxID=1802499 RepID=A0A1F7YI84_9BACT|nr:MAG: hypothetical protein A2141_02835 [Candidatus Woesebacteria bacterium RBG_16_40_11]OGM26982.1 MAG: hypothetical protein A2628_06080 [Candidatus Woesebacteria bacterium RIFCSPHIGHO2_01_FULL_40_22]OGM63257.1 MAG: hypothetical protein A3A76_06140 [Candidatus Woesebacteria bacterium RIFCSPLOWO2_01_FULL_39_23]